MGEQWQGPRLSGHLLHQQVDQTRLEQQTRAVGRALDGRAQVVLVHRPQQVQAALEQPGEAPMPTEKTEPVGAKRHHHACSGVGMPDQGIQERLPLDGVQADRDDLFELVHHQNGRGPQHAGLGQTGHRVRARRHHHDPTAVPAQASRDPGAHQRRLARPRRADDGEDAVPVQEVAARGHVGVAAEVVLGVVHVVGQQSAVRTLRRRSRAIGVGQQGRVLLEDRLLHSHQLRARVQPQLRDQHRSSPLYRRQRLSLASGLVLRPRQQPPSLLPERLLGHQRRCLGQHVPPAPGLQRRLYPQFVGVAAKVLEPLRGGFPWFPPVQLGEGGAVPEPQGFGQRELGALRLAQGQQLT